LAGEESERFCTLTYGHLRPAPGGGVELELVSAGHPPALVRRGDGTVEEGVADGLMLGQFASIETTSAVLSLAPGDTLVLYTDGVIEARSPAGEFFGEERLVEVLRTTAGASAGTTSAAVESAVLRFTGGRAGDDVALLVVQAAPEG
jgi:serine phosphatase RsbU (regulator of sigma subunit)